MAAYVLERAHWDEPADLLAAAKPLKEKDAREWLRTKDWRSYLVDDEALEELNRLAVGIRDVEKRKLAATPELDDGDELLLIGYAPRATPEWKKPGKPVRRRGPNWLYLIYRR
jgi:hypothetical protein